MTLSGSTSSAQARTATGALTLAGSATQTNLVSRTATGGLTLAGSAAQTNRYVRTATGGMTLGGTGAVAVSAATRTATGTLTLGGTANASARAVTTAVGQLTLSGTAEGTATMTYTVFIPPGRNAGRMPTDEMPFALLPAEQSVSVIREGGIYREVEEPTAEEVDAAELVYLGGRRHPVTEQEISDLTTAGYGAWIFEFEEVVGL